MNKYTKDIQVGDIITAYHTGYHKVVSVERRWYTEADEKRYKSPNIVAGKEYGPLISYITMVNGAGKAVKYNNILSTKKCDASFCTKLDVKTVERLRQEEIDAVKHKYGLILDLIND